MRNGATTIGDHLKQPTPMTEAEALKQSEAATERLRQHAVNTGVTGEDQLRNVIAMFQVINGIPDSRLADFGSAFAGTAAGILKPEVFHDVIEHALASMVMSQKQ